MILFALFGPAIGGAAATPPPVAYGKTVLAGVFAVPYGQGSDPLVQGIPALFADGDLVFDSQVSVEVLNTGAAPVDVVISAEEWTVGTITELVNVTGPNGTYALEPENVPARLDPAWSNASISVPGSPVGSALTGVVSLPLPYTGSPRHLELRVGDAVWELSALTPVTSSLAGIYTSGGLQAVALVEAAVTAGVMVAVMFAARGFARKVHRTPRVPKLWPLAWIGIPLLFFLADYVDANQVLGSISSFAYPVFIGAAAFPYLPRLWKDYELGEFEGVEALSTEEVANPKFLLPVVKTKGGWACAPETWREVFYTLIGVPLPEIRGAQVSLLGRKVRVQPRGMAVTSPLADWYRSDADRSYWFDARVKPVRVRHRLSWWRSETVGVPPGAAGTPGLPPRIRRRFSPHVVPGYLSAVFPPKKTVARELAGVRDAETESYDAELYQLAYADLLGTYRHEVRSQADRAIEISEESFQERSRPRALEELRRLIARGERGKGAPPRDDAGAPPT